jgi:hypothetical protein
MPTLPPATPTPSLRADLALYPVPFFERPLEYPPVYFVLPDNPSTTDLSAAATIAAGLGKSSNGEIRWLQRSTHRSPSTFETTII